MTALEEIKKALEGVTPGPWKWFGNANSNHVYLATTHSGRRYVMDFVRWGMRGAQPRFQPERGGMVDAKDLLQFEVGDQSIVGVDAARKDSSVYRYDVRGIDCPDARYIAAVNPAAISDLLSTLESLQRENEALKKDRDFWKEQFQVETRYRIELADRGLALTDANSRAEAAEAEVKRYRVALIAAKTRMRNCRGAIESDQVIDKDVRGSLQNGIRDIQDALASTGGSNDPRNI